MGILVSFVIGVALGFVAGALVMRKNASLIASDASVVNTVVEDVKKL